MVRVGPVLKASKIQVQSIDSQDYVMAKPTGRHEHMPLASYFTYGRFSGCIDICLLGTLQEVPPLRAYSPAEVEES